MGSDLRSSNFPGLVPPSTALQQQILSSVGKSRKGRIHGVHGPKLLGGLGNPPAFVAPPPPSPQLFAQDHHRLPLNGRALPRLLKAAGMPTSTAGIRREHVEAYIEDQLIRHMPSTAATRYRDLKQLFGWLVDEGEIPHHPMARMRPPRLNESFTPLIADSDIRRLLETCSERSFNDRRDTAIMFVFIDTGSRLAEIAGLRVDLDVDFDFDELHVTGKGRRDRAVARQEGESPLSRRGPRRRPRGSRRCRLLRGRRKGASHSSLSPKQE